MKSDYNSRFLRQAFALIELPLVICLFLATVGIITGAILSCRSGRVTAGAWVGFGFVLPLCALFGFVLMGNLRHRRRQGWERRDDT